MPATSKKQKTFMDAVAHNPAFAKKVGVPKAVGKDFSEASKGMKFGKDRSVSTRADRQVINKPKTNQGKAELFKEGGSMATKMNPGMMAIMAKKKPAMKMAGGGAMPMKDGKPAFIGDGKGAMKKGGMAGAMHKMPDGKMMKNSAMKKMASGGLTAGHKAADGVASKGKTKGKMVKMNMGGKAC